LGVAAVYGILHVVLYPVLLFVAFIPVLLSFGLFIFVINAFLQQSFRQVQVYTHGSLIFIMVLRIYNVLYFLLLYHFSHLFMVYKCL
jgi:uncharacterized membrane protein YvlD (DUF360 family)